MKCFGRQFSFGVAAVLPAMALLALLAAGCGGDAVSSSYEPPAVETRADSMAMQMYRAHGGPEVWNGTPALAFTFAIGRGARGDTTRRVAARHWWRRSDGMYRVEWSGGRDSAYVAVFNVEDFNSDPPPGRAMLNGTRLDSAAEKNVLRQAHEKFANDTYWLLAPLKLFNDGVNRSVADAPAAGDSTERSSTERSGAGRSNAPALHLTFDRVGITYEDRYWLWPDSAGRLGRWAFHLQGMEEEQPPVTFKWTGYETFETPAGSLALSTRKERANGPDIIFTDEIRTPDALPDSLFAIAE